MTIIITKGKIILSPHHHPDQNFRFVLDTIKTLFISHILYVIILSIPPPLSPTRKVFWRIYLPTKVDLIFGTHSRWAITPYVSPNSTSVERAPSL